MQTPGITQKTGTGLRCHEVALYSLHAHASADYLKQLPELHGLIQTLNGLLQIHTFRVKERPGQMADLAVWLDAASMQAGGETLLGTEAGQRLFAPVQEVHRMDATLPVFQTGRVDRSRSFSLIVYRLKAERAVFEQARSMLYEQTMGAIPGVAVEQFESTAEPGLFYDLFQAPEDSGTVARLEAAYRSKAMASFEALIEAPQFSGTLEPVAQPAGLN